MFSVEHTRTTAHSKIKLFSYEKRRLHRVSCLFVRCFFSFLHQLLRNAFNLLHWKIHKTRDKRKHWRKIFPKREKIILFFLLFFSRRSYLFYDVMHFIMNLLRILPSFIFLFCSQKCYALHSLPSSTVPGREWTEFSTVQLLLLFVPLSLHNKADFIRSPSAASISCHFEMLEFRKVHYTK